MLSPVAMISMAVVVIAGAVGLYFWQGSRTVSQNDQRFAQAAAAKATIIEVGTSIVGKSTSKVSAALRFEVQRPDGTTYKTRSPWIIEPAHIGQVRLGTSLPVKIDAKEKNVVFPDVAWAKYDWSRYGEPEPIYED